MFGGLNNFKGRTVEIYTSSQGQHDLFTETGVLTNILIGQGENAVFVELDNGTIINVRYIIKIVVK